MASIRASRIWDNRLSARTRASRICDNRPVSVKGREDTDNGSTCDSARFAALERTVTHTGTN